MLVAFGELTPFAWGLLGIVALFSVQLLLCFKAKRKAVKGIPIYLLIVVMLICGMMYLGIFGRYSFGAISGNELVAIIFATIDIVAAMGVLLAWLVYGVVSILKGNQR